ncbi:hypothetical protein L1987_86346 [Smallanthus sonchifolius]|uniref:Uncharacterized protein n=1 Tax=Smallanthus sonchifolius TaxID=185202 RepID=A0ACB8XZ59_9ASTR|nr:hypothetical protein L1987_86346 [Smallanthus sonchifolius]
MPEDTVVKHAKLVEVVRELITNNDVTFDDLLMVDALERLGLDYHYEDEINLILEQCYLQFTNKDFIEYRNLYEVSLCFRILRQKGFRVSADVFKLLKGKNGQFVETLKHDIRGLMELYEASQLCIEGENILDEAATFSSHILQKSLNVLDDKEARMVVEGPRVTSKALLKTILRWATLCDAFLVEAKWFASGHIPNSEEYLKNGIVSSGVQDGNQDGHDGSYVKCFIMEHEYCSAKIAREYVKKMISAAWKCLNKECLSPIPFSNNFKKGSINLAR